MNNSTQVTAFVVLVVALAGAMVLVNNQDIDTEVNTVEESRLPQVYEVNDFSFRYPRSWTVSGDNRTGITLSRPQDLENRQGEQYEFSLTLSEQDAPDPATLLNGGENAEVLEIADLPAAQAVNTTSDGVSYGAAILLDENVYLTVANTTPISEENWGEMETDVDHILNSIEVGEEFHLVGSVFTYILPENWTAEDTGSPVVRMYTPATAASNEAHDAELQILALPKEQMTEALRNLLGLQQVPGLAEITDPIELVEALPQAGTPYEPTETSYFGFEGYEFILTGLGSNDAKMTVLDAEDEHAIVMVQLLSLTSENQEALVADMGTLIETIGYSTPDASFFEN